MTGPDVVGVGALNLDYLARVVLPPALERGVEHSVGAGTVADVLGSTDYEVALGGSAFTTIHTMARAGSGLRLGYVGVAGWVPPGGLSAVAALDAYGTDRRFVFSDDRMGGVCVSVMHEGERTLLTHAGANTALADHLDAHFDEVVAYLGSARLIHVTSFLDERTPGRLLAVLRAVKATSPQTLISCDPGHVWCVDRTDEIDGMLRLSDYLLLNRRERRELTDPPAQAVLVVKQPDGIDVNGTFIAQTPLTESEIVDATGAGDVFAAGLLLELAVDPARLVAGCERGLRLARLKLSGAAGSPDGRG
ncbi:carbohydrate kinase family protein [Actinoplanes sp. TRM 88003]|uniref:adenosine kinase n=1 Tax=Paractinoplanes aksuensis TaxID=2939490 RepID=A0ABT1E2I8_9ACTN|nr:carbohydrate kinase family protein [Actinoplanes aksuensis]MCO8277063.1 carbohydrate kinase family protein [Actinoplanes aksuensis]